MIFRSRRKVSLSLEQTSVLEVGGGNANVVADSIAGAMAAFKGQPTADPDKSKRVRKPAKPVDDESDYESGTDEDEETESETDTDTDSDEE